MTVRLAHLALLLTVFTAVGTGALGQSATPAKSPVSASANAELPKHPIPYKAFKQKPAKPKPKVKPVPANAAPPTAVSGSTAAVKAAPTPGSGPAKIPLAKPTSAPPSAPAKPMASPKPTTAPPPSAAPAPIKTPPPLATAPIPTAPQPTTVTPTAKPPTPAPVTAPLAAPQVGARLSVGAPLPASELEAFIDGEVMSAMASQHVAGAAIAVVQNGQLVMEKGYGRAAVGHALKLDPRTSLIRLGSGSQIFTWIAALKAVEEGKLKLDAPVNGYLPEDLKLPDEGFDRPVLFRHLMSHTAGFEDRALGRRYVQDAGKLQPLETALVKDRPRRVRAAGLLSIPSDYGVALAGDIVARAEGRPFDQLIETEILKPLALSHTSFREPYPAGNNLPDPMSQTLANTAAEGFRWTPQGFEPQPYAYGQSLAPAISASTTADDMARLMIALLNGGRLGEASIYGPKSAALLRAPLQRPTAGMDGWAHGLAMQSIGGGLEALTERGASPDFRSNLFLVPSLNLGVFIVANTDTGTALTNALPGMIVQRFYGSKPPTPSAPPSQPDYAGPYLSTMRAYHGLEAFADRLTRRSTLTPDGAGGLILSDPSGSRVFSPTETAGRLRSEAGVELFTPAVKDKVGVYVLGSGSGAAERVGGVHSPGVLTFWAVATALTVLASFAGLFIRDRLDHRASRAQITANITQIVTCVVWCLAFTAFALFAKDGLSQSRLMFDWPNRWLVLASWSALAAGVLSLLMIAQLPGAWREERRIDGWSIWRKLRHTTTVGVFLVFTGVLAAWGALEPWSS